jgi:hypothetical protein
MTEEVEAKTPEEQEEVLLDQEPKTVEEKLDFLAYHLSMLIAGVDILAGRLDEIEAFLLGPEEEEPSNGGH